MIKATIEKIIKDLVERMLIAEDFIERHGFNDVVKLYIPNVMLLNRDGINLELWDHNAYIRWCNNVDLWNDREDAGEMYMYRWNDAIYWVNSLRTIVEGSESVYPEAEMILQVMDDDGLNVPTITWHTNLNTWDNTGDGSYSLVRTAAGGGAEVMFYLDKDEIIFNDAGRDTDFRIETDTEEYAVFLNSGTEYLGIRTGTPVAFLHIYTDDVISDAAMLRIEQDGTGDANLEWYLGPGSRWVMGIDNSDGNRWKLAMSSDLGTNTHLVVDAGGDLGIRCNPIANMHLHDPTTFCYFYITTGNVLTDVGIFFGLGYTATDFYIGIDEDDGKMHLGAGGVIGTNSAIRIDNTGVVNMVVGNITVTDGGWIGQAAGPLLTFDDGNNYLEITGCNVGIGTTIPNCRVEIVGGAGGVSTDLLQIRSNAVTVNTATGIRFVNSTSRVTANIGLAGIVSTRAGAGGETTLEFKTYNGTTYGTRMYIDIGGLVSIGHAVPATLLHLLRSSAELRIETADATDPTLSFKTTNTAHQIDISLDESDAALDILDIGATLYVEDTNNRVGIGVNDPAVKLEVFDVGIQLQLSYDATDFATFQVDTNGDLTITASGDEILVADVVRGTTSLWYRATHIPAFSLSPGASGATFVPPSVDTLGGWQLNADDEYLYSGDSVTSMWDGASDLSVRVTWEVNEAAAADGTVDLQLICYYKGNHETAVKSQTLEDAHTITGDKARYTRHTTIFTIDWDAVGNIVEVGDKIHFRLNLETDTSECDDIIINTIMFRYKTAKMNPEV